MIRELVEAAGLTLSELRVLDFGCGCGRIARHMLPLVRELHGIDPNRRSVAWCARNLSNGTFLAGGREPTLPFPDGRFDLVWAWSVFTHLPAVSQRPWLAELTRIVAPGGLILFTTHGPPRAGDLRPELKAVFDRGELVVRFDEAPGTNLCAVYHPRQYVVGELLAGLELVRTFAPEQEPERAAAFRVMQDVYLARKRR
jgi:SAM-dependent methyltransferase